MQMPVQRTEIMKIANLTIAAAFGLPIFSAGGGSSSHLHMPIRPSLVQIGPGGYLHKKMLAALTLGLFLAGVPGLARAAASFTFTTIDVPGSTGTDANGNSTHAIAGDFT